MRKPFVSRFETETRTMNGTPQENEQKKAARMKAESMADDFKRSQAAMTSKADELMSKAVRLRFPLMHANAVQAGHLVGKMTLEVVFDFTAGKKKVEVRSAVLPPPVVTLESKVVNY